MLLIREQGIILHASSVAKGEIKCYDWWFCYKKA